MKLLILGNHARTATRGDSAILRGLPDAINILSPHAEVDVMSRYPVGSSWQPLNRPVMGDPLFLQMKKHNSAAGVAGRVRKFLRHRYQHQVVLPHASPTLASCVISPSPRGSLTSCDCCQVTTPLFRSADRFCRFYGVPQFEHALCTFMAKSQAVYDWSQRRPVPG